MRAPVRVDHAPHVRSAAGQYQDAFGFWDFVNQQSVWRMKLPGSAQRKTARVRVALRLLGSTNFVQSLGLRHEWNLINLDVGRKIVAVLPRQRSRAGVPISELARRGAEHRVSIRITWCGGRRRPLRLASSATPALLGSGGERQQDNNNNDDSGK